MSHVKGGDPNDQHTLAEADQVLELYGVDISHSHSNERHGPNVTDDYLVSRLTGDPTITPPAIDATRFIDEDAMRECRDICLSEHTDLLTDPVKIDEGKLVLTSEFQDPIGVGIGNVRAGPDDAPGVTDYTDVRAVTLVLLYDDTNEVWYELTMYPNANPS